MIGKCIFSVVPGVAAISLGVVTAVWDLQSQTPIAGFATQIMPNFSNENSR